MNKERECLNQIATKETAYDRFRLEIRCISPEHRKLCKGLKQSDIFIRKSNGLAILENDKIGLVWTIREYPHKPVGTDNPQTSLGHVSVYLKTKR